MWFLSSSRSILLVLCTVALSAAASSWSFDDATISTHGKKAGVGGGLKEKITPNKALSKAVQLSSTDSLKILLTAKEGNTARRPHQAFLTLKDPKTNLDTSFAFQVKENGKGKVDISQKDIPTQLLSTSESLEAYLVIASFGSSAPYQSKAFDLAVELGSPVPKQDTPLRYGKLPEIHHIFKSDPSSPSKIITLFFTATVIAALPLLFGAWLSLGANLNHITKAFSASPISHTLYFVSILAMEGVFFMYYTSWNLFQTLPGAVGIALVTFLSGTRALREVQERRLAGFR